MCVKVNVCGCKDEVWWMGGCKNRLDHGQGVWPEKAIHVKLCGQHVIRRSQEHYVSEIDDWKLPLEKSNNCPHQSKLKD